MIHHQGHKEDLDRIVETIIYLVTESRRISKDVASRYGVTPTQLTVLKLLHEIGDLSLGRLSRQIRSHNSTVTGIVDRMVAAGLVVREQSADDRRVWKIKLTPQGRTIAKKLDIAPWEILRQALEALPEGELEALIATLAKVAQNVQRLVEAP